MSVDSGVSGPVEGPGVAAPAGAGNVRSTPRLGTRRGVAAADALADAVSTPSFRSGRGRPRRRGRRVTRVLRRIELWSVLKIALVFNTIMLGVALGTVALLWGLANTTGLVDDLEGFLRDAGFEDFRFQGDRMFEQVAFIGAVGALAATVFMVLAAALLNLIAEITGGIKFVVIEEIVEPAPQPARAPAPLALPTVPATSPPVVAPSPPGPRPDPTPSGPPPLAKTTSPDRPYDVDADGGGDEAEERTAPRRPPAKKAAAKKRPTKKAAARQAPAKRAPTANRSGADRPASGGGRRVRRQGSAGPDGETSRADDDTSA